MIADVHARLERRRRVSRFSDAGEVRVDQSSGLGLPADREAFYSPRELVGPGAVDHAKIAFREDVVDGAALAVTVFIVAEGVVVARAAVEVVVVVLLVVRVVVRRLFEGVEGVERVRRCNRG